MSAFDRMSDQKVATNSLNYEAIDTLKQLHVIDTVLKDLDF